MIRCESTSRQPLFEVVPVQTKACFVCRVQAHLATVRTFRANARSQLNTQKRANGGRRRRAVRFENRQNPFFVFI